MSICPQIFEVEFDFNPSTVAEDDVTDPLTTRTSISRVFLEGQDVRVEKVAESVIVKRI